MPLCRAKEVVLVTMNGVKFLMRDGSTEIPCRASRALLAERFDSDGERETDEATFRRHRVAIELAASNKYDAGKVEDRVDPKVIVTTFDMASPLSRKF